MELFVFWLAMSVVPALIASKKGHSFIGWWLYGVLLWPIALVHSLVISDSATVSPDRGLAKGTRQPCPFCAEPIRVGAVVCRYCGRDLPEPIGGRQCTDRSKWDPCRGDVMTSMEDGLPRCEYHIAHPRGGLWKIRPEN